MCFYAIGYRVTNSIGIVNNWPIGDAEGIQI